MSLLDQLFGITTIYKDGANPLSRSALNFVGDVTVVDDSANGWIRVTIGSGIVASPADPADDGQLLYADSGTYVLTDNLTVHDTAGVIDGFETTSGDFYVISAGDFFFRTDGGDSRVSITGTANQAVMIYKYAGATDQYLALEYNRVAFTGQADVQIGFYGSPSPLGGGQALNVWGQDALAASGTPGGEVVIYTGAGDGAGADGVYDVCIGGSGGDREFRVGGGYVGLGSGNLAGDGSVRLENAFEINRYVAGGTLACGVLQMDGSNNLLVGEVPGGGEAPTATVTVESAAGLYVQQTHGASQKALLSGTVLSFQGGGACTVSGSSHPSGSGTTFTLEGMDAFATSGGDGGDLVILPGLADGAGTSGHLQLQDASGNLVIDIGSTSALGFFGTAAIVKPTVAGAKAGNAALTSLCTQLAALGLIIDTTT